MDWKPAENQKDNSFKIPERWLHIHYYEALNILFRFENSLRVFVYSILKNAFFEEWKTKTFETGDGHQKSIENLAAKRISMAENFGYLGYDVKCPIMHLTSGELVELLTSDAYWPIFRNHFRGNKEIIKNKLLEIGNIRNSLAHFRPIKQDDVEVIKQNSKHTLVGVEDCLENVFSLNLSVPTNTQDQWYKELSTVGNSYVTTIPMYSKDEEWVNLQLSFKSVVIDKSSYGTNHFGYKITRLLTPNVVRDHNVLARYVTYVSEYLYYPGMNEKYDIQVTKIINMVFLKRVLVQNLDQISKTLKEIISKIQEEVDLLVNDNLARGNLLDSVRCSAYWVAKEDKGHWNFYYDSVACPYQPGHADEYWGDLLIGTDVVSGAKRYPWMPSDISGDEFPF